MPNLVVSREAAAMSYVDFNSNDISMLKNTAHFVLVLSV